MARLFFYFFKTLIFLLAVLGLCGYTGFFLVAASGGQHLVSVLGLLLLQNTDSRCVGFTSCCVGAALLCSMWDLPRSKIKPMPPLH